MPIIVKLLPEEVASIRNSDISERRRVAAQYDALLAEFALGDWGDVMIDASESKVTVRNRLRAAAERRGAALRFARGRDNRMRFQLVADDGPNAVIVAPAASNAPSAPQIAAPAESAPTPESPIEAAPPAEAAAAPARRRGRPRATSAPAAPPQPAWEPRSPAPPEVAVPTPRQGGRKRRTQDGG